MARPVSDLKRVCYMLMTFPQVSETFIAEEALFLKNHGLDVRILALNRGNGDLVHPSAQALLSENRVRYAETISRRQALRALPALIARKPLAALVTLCKALVSRQRWRYFQALPYALDLLERQSQYLHAHFADQNLAFAQVLSAWTAIPYGFTAHGYDLRDDPLPVDGFSRLARQAATVVTVSEDNKRLISDKYRLPADKIYVAYNGIQINCFQPAARPINPPPLRLISVGRLVPVKGHDILLAALQRVRDRGYAVQLKLIGDGKSRTALEAQTQQLALDDCVVFLGAQSQAQIRRHLQEADVFVMPSRQESFGVACLEAMAMALPVIASQVGGLPEVVGHPETGLLTEAENPDSLADAIVWMITHPKQRIAMGEKARQRAVTQFSRESVTLGLLKHWQSALSLSSAQ